MPYMQLTFTANTKHPNTLLYVSLGASRSPLTHQCEALPQRKSVTRWDCCRQGLLPSSSYRDHHSLNYHNHPTAWEPRSGWGLP